VEFQLPAGARVDLLAQVVAVPGLRVEDREDDQLRGAAFQLTIERPGVDD
jgi:hypothetical protein